MIWLTYVCKGSIVVVSAEFVGGERDDGHDRRQAATPPDDVCPKREDVVSHARWLVLDPV